MPFDWERSPIASSPISAILIARQAARTVGGVLEALATQLSALKREHEMLVVDDGSSDGTAAAVEAFAEKEQRVRLLPHEKPLGYGAALRTGLAAARHPLVCTLPADGSYAPADLPKLLEWIDKADAVIGVRRPRPRLKVWSQHWLVRLWFGVQLADPACHFRLYRRDILTRFPIQSQGCFADVEIAAKANYLECLLAEAEVTWQPPAQPIAGPSALREAWRLFRRRKLDPPST